MTDQDHRHETPGTPGASGARDTSGTLDTPGTPARRALAPDLARGAMILLIAIANVPWYLYGQTHAEGTIQPVGGSVGDRVVQAVTMTAVDMRVYPMFAFLLGYGMWQFAQSRRARGVSEPAVRRMLRRRHLGLILFGGIHAALLFVGDILGAYGLVGLVLVAAFFRRTDRTIAVWCAVLTAIGVLYLGFSLVGAWFMARSDPGGEPAASSLSNLAIIGVNGEGDYVASMGDRLVSWATFTPFEILMSPIPLCVLAAFLAARHRVLEEPERHRRLLTWVAALGIGVAWAAALPGALDHVGVIDLAIPATTAWALVVVQQATGVLGGLGYVGLFALLALRLERRGGPGRAGAAVAAVGRRSLSTYLLQSVILAPALCAWGLGLGAHLGSLAAAGLALATWILALALCVRWDATNRRGPAEAALRRLTYGRDDPAPAPAPAA